MQEIRTQLDVHGRVLIPAIIRKKMNLKPGDTLTLRATEEEIKMVSMKSVIREAQELIKKYKKPEESLVDSFIKMRRQESQLEESRNHQTKD